MRTPRTVARSKRTGKPEYAEALEGRRLMAAFAIPGPPLPIQYEQFTLSWDHLNTQVRYELTADNSTSSNTIQKFDASAQPVTELDVNGQAGGEVLSLDFSKGPLSRSFPGNPTYVQTIRFADPHGNGPVLHNTLVIIGGAGKDELRFYPGYFSITSPDYVSGDPPSIPTDIYYDKSVTRIIFQLGGGDDVVIGDPMEAIGSQVTVLWVPEPPLLPCCLAVLAMLPALRRRRQHITSARPQKQADP